MRINNLTWGLFKCRFPYHWGKDFKILLKRIIFLFKHGYQEQVQWETYACFIEMWQEILEHYKTNREGTPILIDSFDVADGTWYQQNAKAYDQKIDNMLADLRIMAADPLDDPNGVTAGSKARQEAADRFFASFKEIFFHLWD